LRATAKARRQERLPQPRRRQRRRKQLLHRDQGVGAQGSKNQLAANAPHLPSPIKYLLWQLARRSRKSPLHARGARPNHVGAAIARYKRAGRIEERNGKLYATSTDAVLRTAV
jgi:hypothetical protein